MPAQRYNQYFNIAKKFYPVVTKELIDKGEVKWNAFFPHETFVYLLRQITDMLSGKEHKSIWVEGAYGTGKSHAALAAKCLLEAPEQEVRDYFSEYGLNMDLCNRFLTARSEEMNGKLIVVHRVGSSAIKNDDDLIWAVQSSIKEALSKAGIENMASGTMKDGLLAWINENPAYRTLLASLISDNPGKFGGMNIDMVIDRLNSDDQNAIDALMEKLIPLGREATMTFLRMDAEKLANWIREVITANGLGAIVFVWDEFSEFFKNCQNSLTGFQTLVEISESNPFYFVIVTHESDGLIKNASDRSKISNRFIEPRVHIELPDNMAFRLMAKAMKTTDDPQMANEWDKVRNGLNARLGNVRAIITAGAKKHAKAGTKTVLSDEDLQKIVPLHPYAALVLKHISRVFTASQRSMFDFIVARDPDEDDDGAENALACRAFKWFINNHNAASANNLMTVDMLWDFFNAKAGGNMNPDALEILRNYDLLTSEFQLNPEEQRVLKTVLLMNAICTRVQEADMLAPTYTNIDLAFLGTGWQPHKAENIARAMVHRQAPLQPVLFEEPMQDGTMRVIPKATGGADIAAIKDRIRAQLVTKDVVEASGLEQALRLPDNLSGHFKTNKVYVNANSTLTFTNSFKDVKIAAQNQPDRFQLCFVFALTDEERSAANRHIKSCMTEGIPDNILLMDATTNPFTAYLDNYVTNLAYAEYYAKSDKKQSSQFASYAQKNLDGWKEQVKGGEFRLYDMNHKNGQMRIGYSNMNEVFQAINHEKYPFGIEQFNVLPSLFAKNSMGQGAEYGLTQTEKGAYSTDKNQAQKSLSNALQGAWGEEGAYWEDPNNQRFVIVRLKKEVEAYIAENFEKTGRVNVIDIVHLLEKEPFGITPSNLSAYVLGFLLKEYANEKYFWSNGATRPMSVDLMKASIKNALDQIGNPKASYRVEAIVTMSESLRYFLKATASLFRESSERCGSVDAAGGVIRLGMKKLDFPIWVLKAILPKEQLTTDTAIISEVIDKYLGIANIRNYPQYSTESELADDIGAYFRDYPNLEKDLTSLFISQKTREAMIAYLNDYRNGELPALAAKIKDNGNYVAEVKKKFNADEANWVWSDETAKAKIDEVILEYTIVAESNTVVAPASSLAGCMRNWKDKINNFRISRDAMASETGELDEFLGILYEIRQCSDNTLPENKKQRFLDLLSRQKSDFNQLYTHQETVFTKIAAAWLSELSEDDISDFYVNYMDTGVFCDTSEKFFRSVETKVNSYIEGQRSKRLTKLWREKTSTNNPYDWSRIYSTPILCMFDDAERLTAKEVFDILRKAKPSEAEFQKAENWINATNCFERLASGEERDSRMLRYVIGDYSLILPNVDKVRGYLHNKASMIQPYDWMDNSIIRGKIRELADMKYKTGAAAVAEQAVADLTIDELQSYVRDLIRSDMSVGIAILKKHKK